MDELSKAYDPSKFEESIYTWWEVNNYFKPEKQRDLGFVNDESDRYCLTLPPPNVTGTLHLGHGITIAIEDLMVRYARMQQKETLFQPGSDHAGIATQNVVERELLKKGIKRKELGREKFIEEVWKWKKKYHARITEQSKRLGMSSDWSRERFTLDENMSKAVRKAFVSLYKKDLIYKGSYLINWCPGRCESAISDLEAISEEENGNLWYIKYPVIDETWKGPKTEWGSGTWVKGAKKFIEIATTRPETLLGDTAVATKKEHLRFGKLIGNKAILPVLGRKILIIEDEYVDTSFGTGAVKITPGHDSNDYEIGKRHNLEFITVLDPKARLIEEYSGPYSNMDRFEARKAIVEDLEKEGLLVKIEPYKSSIPRCERCHTIIEPRISVQWFVKTKPLAERAIEQVRKGATVIIPDREEKRFYQWMENIRDWCISRQLWWGHRIPIWYCPDGHQTCEEEDPTKCSECGSKDLHQDPDVLDTWFSSGLWPISTLGWGWDDNSYDFKRFYPTDMRETGYDILFFWVSREIMLCSELTGVSPYKTVYLHGIIRNEKGEKISKSMENIEEFDPLNIIAKDGADALRYTLATNSMPGLDTNLDLRRVKSARRFCNKIWQSTRFILGNLDKNTTYKPLKSIEMSKLEDSDIWILSKLYNLVKQITEYMDTYQYLEAGREINTFFWNIFCDFYLEFTKIRIYDDTKDKMTPSSVLLHVLETSFRLLHPFMPFITEKLWQSLPSTVKESEALIVSSWPKLIPEYINNTIGKRFETIINIIKAVRSIRGEYRINLTRKVALFIITKNTSLISIIKSNKDEICTLAKVDSEKFIISKTKKPYKNAEKTEIENITVYVPLTGLIDFNKEMERINKNINKLSKILIQSENKLKNDKFMENASKKVIDNEKLRFSDTETKINKLKDQLQILE
ncbi:MAG: Valine--tRNA ligase [Candidatus Heimdallarchaeota archaeon LC_3]|nr:MAG: Valine--tRNA ligase [Candidatus Heimdallarchaeota archaeon LC_3]